jgi:hypothetical protein
MVMGAESPYQPFPQVDLRRILRETNTSILANERTKKRMKNRFINHPRSLFIACVILGASLIGILIFFGATATTRGPIEMLLALLIGALVLFFRALSHRSR